MNLEAAQREIESLKRMNQQGYDKKFEHFCPKCSGGMLDDGWDDGFRDWTCTECGYTQTLED